MIAFGLFGDVHNGLAPLDGVVTLVFVDERPDGFGDSRYYWWACLYDLATFIVVMKISRCVNQLIGLDFPFTILTHDLFNDKFVLRG